MPSGQFENVAEDWGSLTPEANPTHAGARIRPLSDTDFDDLLGGFAQALSSCRVREPIDVSTEASKLLAAGLKADRVSFYGSTDRRADHFERIADWPGVRSTDHVRRVGSAPTEIDLGALPEGGAALRRGQPWIVDGGRIPVASTARSPLGRPAAWTRMRSVLYLPCLGATGLLGFFSAESGSASPVWSERMIRRVSAVGPLVAGSLDRARLASEVETLRRQLADQTYFETIGLAAGSLAHDFNNVLTAILGYAELAEMELPERSPGRLELAEIHAAAIRGADLVEEVLAPDRNRDGAAVSVDLNAGIEKLEGMIRRVAGPDIDVELDLTDQPLPVRVAPGEFERALLNLASNAKNAHPPAAQRRGRLVLSTAQTEIDAAGRDLLAACDRTGPRNPSRSDLAPGHYLRLSVRDDGCGIDRDLQDKIFDAFFTTRAEGTGRGLTTVAEFMKRSQGAIRVESAPGEGTCFQLYFPVDGSPIDPIDGSPSKPLPDTGSER